MVGNHAFSSTGRRDSSYNISDKSNIRRVLNNISNSLIDEKGFNGTVSGTSCMSGLTTRSLELQQKFRRRMMNKRVNTKSRSDGLPEISEEYDIQTIVSGLTRNSEFPEHRDPPASVDHELDNSTEWPDDETCGGYHGHHVISIMDGDQMMSKDTIPSQKESRVSQSRNEKRVPLPEPEEMRSKKDHHEKATSKICKMSRRDPEPQYENILSPEPDGVKFRNGSQKIAVEPSGKKIETLIYSCALKNDNHKNTKSRRRDPTVYMNDDDVEVVYQEKYSDLSNTIDRKLLRRRSRSTNAPKRMRDSGLPLKSTTEKRSVPEPSGKSRSVYEKRRSRSLPRTLKRITSRYRKEKVADSKRDPSPSERTPHSIDPHFIDEIFSAVENKTVSTLGSRCEGIESKESKRKNVKNAPTNYSNHKFSPYSREEVFSSHPCEMKCEDSEPRVCVEFAPRQSGGYFSTTCFADKKGTNRRNNEIIKRDEDKHSRTYPIKEVKTPDDASKIVFPGFDTHVMEKLPKKFSNNRNKDKVRIGAIVEEASKKLLLSPNGDEDSFVESDNLFERHRSAPSHLELKQDNSHFAKDTSNQVSFYPTPVPEKELRREFLGHKSSEYIDEPAISSLSMTPSGRKDLIQRYLSLREKHSKLEASFSSGQSVDSNCNIDDTNSVVQNSSSGRSNKIREKSGYDDASKHYQNGDSEQWPISGSFTTREDYERISSFPEQIEGVETPLSSGSKSRMRISNSEGRNMGGTRENIFSLPNAYKQQANVKENWSSPSMVSSFPYSHQERLSYSYASDDDSCASNMFGGYRSDSNSPYTFPAKSNYEEELRPHNQFMKMQIGIGNQ